MLRLFRIFALSISLALLTTGCSTGDLSRSEAKKKLSLTIDMCNPCEMEEFAAYPFGTKLIKLGYLDQGQLTPFGQKALGKDAIVFTRYAGPGSMRIAAFKKEIDEVTGIAAGPKDAGTAEVQFTYRIMPLFDILRDDPQLAKAVLDRYGSNHIDRMGKVEEKDGKFIAFHATGQAKFKKYDDGWRVEHANPFNNFFQLNMLPLGGSDRSFFK